MKYEEFEETVLPNKPEYIREGQALINYLGDVWIEEYPQYSIMMRQILIVFIMIN